MIRTVSTAIGRAWSEFARMMEVSASRHQLAELDDAALHDLGISRAQARFEATRAPWDIGPSAEPQVRRASAQRRGAVGT